MKQFNIWLLTALIEAEKKRGERGREKTTKKISLEVNLIFFQSMFYRLVDDGIENGNV